MIQRRVFAGCQHCGAETRPFSNGRYRKYCSKQCAMDHSVAMARATGYASRKRWSEQHPDKIKEYAARQYRKLKADPAAYRAKRAAQNAAWKRRYLLRKNLGLCTLCAEPADTGVVYCARHRAESSGRRNTLRKQRRADGKCVDCGIVSTPKEQCQDCRATWMARRRRRMALRRRLGFCTWCLEPAAKGHTLCTRHLAYMRNTNQKRQEKVIRKRGYIIGRIQVSA